MMDEIERKERAKALREEQRSGRASSASQDSIGKRSAPDTTERTTLQIARGKAEPLTPTGGKPAESNRRNRNNRSSTERLAGRSGRSDRRHSQNDGGAADNSETMEREAGQRAEGERSVGRLIADEQPIRPDKPEATFARQSDGQISTESATIGTKADYRKRNLFGKGILYIHKESKATISEEQYADLAEGKAKASQNSSAESEKPNWWSGNGVLSATEATELYEPLIECIKDDGRYLDKAIALKNPIVGEEPIWGNLTDDEAQILAELLLKAGRKSPQVALAIRTSIEIKSYAAALMILGPRIQLTAMAIRTAPQATQQPRRFSLFRPVEAGQ